MSTPVSVLPAGVQASDASPATGRISANTRVSAAAGNFGLVTDVMQFSGLNLTGAWVTGATRVMVNGIPVVNQAAAGTSFSPVSAATGPMLVVQGDPRITAS